MELNEALDFLIRKDKINEAYECIYNNRSEVEDGLIEKLRCAINNIEMQQEVSIDCDLDCVLNLLANLQVKKAFNDILKILELKDYNICKRFFEIGTKNKRFEY